MIKEELKILLCHTVHTTGVVLGGDDHGGSG